MIFTFLKYVFFLILFPSAVFSQNKNSNEVRFIAAGDLNLAHWITPIIEKKGNDYPFKYLKDQLSEADLVFSNLEAPFCNGGEPYPKNFVFKVPVQHVQVLKSGNINMVSLANNHILDYGQSCLNSTVQILQNKKIFYAGAGSDFKKAHKPAIFKIKDIKFAFFAYSMTLPKYFFATDSTGGTAYPHKKILKDSISYYNNKVDYIIVSFHWGEELTTLPKEYQRNYAHLAIEYGADIILGHHPHVLQGIEVYKNKIIVYSLGNFVFASYSNKASDSILLDLQFTKKRIKDIKVVPLNVNNYEVNFRPQILRGNKKTEVIGYLQKISDELNGHKQIINADGYLIL
ncbi:MAG: CapA family protein [Calditrichia bacterium]|nr:CapA family protein [Calditrichia bacterium]